MFQSMSAFRLSAALLAAMVFVAGCQSSETVKQEPAPKPAPVTKAPAPAPVTVAPSGMVKTAIALPTGDRSTSGLLIEKMAPAEVTVGEEYTYTLKATNLTGVSLSNVVVQDMVPGDFKVADSSPKASTSGGTLTWELGTIAPRGVKTITVKGSAVAAGTIQNCVTGSYDLVGCLVVNVTQPALKIVKSQTEAVLQCDPITQTITVTNTGTGVAKGVTVTENLPNGLMTADGKTNLTWNLGDLAEGKSRTITTTMKASKTGTFKTTANVASAGGLKGSASRSTKVTKPKLEITKTGTQRTFAGRNIEYTITVTNTGDGVAKNTMVTDGVPGGTTFVSASAGGTMANGSVSWNLGDLAPGAKKTLGMVVKSNQIMNVNNVAAANAYCADAVTANHTTKVEGIPAILLEVVDISDPIEVGKNETYVITATNQGSAVDTNIKIVVDLENAQSYVSSSGATQGTVRGQTITFAPLASLAPKAKATWKVVVKAEKPGDVRFKVTMDTDELTRPVQETEATNQYE